MNIIREIIRFYSKFTDYFFLTKNFHKYQIKYSNIYSNNYFLEKDQYSFVHIPKTAGTSVSKLIKNNNKVNQGVHNLVSIHCDPSEYNYITVIRDPIERLKSMYEMQMNNKKLAFHRHAKKGLDYFVKKLTINQNCICKFLIGDLNTDIDEIKYTKAINNLKNFFYIIDYENLYEDTAILKKKLNISESLNHIGKKKNKKKIIYNENQIKTIIEYNYFDIKIYKWYIKNIKSLGL
jgi:hypothetical protein